MSATILEKISAILGTVKFAQTTEVKLMEIIDANGNTYSVEALEVGKSITMDGVTVPEGEYILDNKTILTDKDGIITSVEEVVIPAQMAADAITMEQVQSMIDAAIAGVVKLSSEKILTLQTKLSENEETIKTVFSSCKEAIEELATTPAISTVHVQKLSSQKELDKSEKRNAFATAIQELVTKK